MDGQREDRWNIMSFLFFVFFPNRRHNLSRWYRFNERADCECGHVVICLCESVCERFVHIGHICVYRHYCVHRYIVDEREWLSSFIICFVSV